PGTTYEHYCCTTAWCHWCKMTWTSLLSATLLGTLVVIGANPQFRNNGITSLNAPGSGTPNLVSGPGSNGLQGNFGGVGAEVGGVNRFGSARQGGGGYNYAPPANPLTLGGSATRGPAGGIQVPFTAPQTPNPGFGFPRGGQAGLGGAGLSGAGLGGAGFGGAGFGGAGAAPRAPPVLPGNGGTLQSTISQILQRLTGGQVASVVGPNSGRNNLPIGNVNFFTASDPTQAARVRAPAASAPAHNFQFRQSPRTQTNAFVAIAPDQIPSRPRAVRPQPQAFIPTPPAPAPAPTPAPAPIPVAPAPVAPAPAGGGVPAFGILLEQAQVSPQFQPVGFQLLGGGGQLLGGGGQLLGGGGQLLGGGGQLLGGGGQLLGGGGQLLGGGGQLLGGGGQNLNSFRAVQGVNNFNNNNNQPIALQLVGGGSQNLNGFGSLQGFNNLNNFQIVDLASLGLGGQQIGGLQITPDFSQSQFGGQSFGNNLQGNLQNNAGTSLLTGTGAAGFGGTGTGGAGTGGFVGVGLQAAQTGLPTGQSDFDDRSLLTGTGAAGFGGTGTGGVGTGSFGNVGTGGFGGSGSGGAVTGNFGGVGAAGFGGAGTGGFEGVGLQTTQTGLQTGGAVQGNFGGVGAAGVGGAGAGGFDVGTGLGAGGGFADGVPLTDAVPTATGANQVGVGFRQGNAVSNLIVGSSNVGATQGSTGSFGQGIAGSFGQGIAGSSAQGSAGSSAQGISGSGVTKSVSGASPSAARLTGVPLFLTGPQGPAQLPAGVSNNQLDTVAKSLQSEALPAAEALTAAQEPVVEAAAAAGGSQGTNAVEAAEFGKRTLPLQTQPQLTGISISETGPQLSSSIPGSAPETSII
ncbi:unnamed protein product, partial [Meganyctiphanes norvegica]